MRDVSVGIVVQVGEGPNSTISSMHKDAWPQAGDTYRTRIERLLGQAVCDIQHTLDEVDRAKRADDEAFLKGALGT